MLYGQAPIKIDYACPAEDLESFGLGCTNEDPCPVFLDLSAVEAVGAKLFAAGNLHTQSSTLYSVLLLSEDSGRTWIEPMKRIRTAALEQIQFVDFANGWVSGQNIEPLPRDPFLLLTTDGGTTWTRRPVFEETRVGSVAEFRFESQTTGELVVDHREHGVVRHEVLQSNTGGENWEPKESTTQPVKLKGSKDPGAWRIRVDPASKTYHLEQHAGAHWELVSRFAIQVADCK
jgi:photosystem II stability/assembly factor-like uncharacterized protein